MSMLSGNFSELLEPGLRKVYGDTYEQFPEEYSAVFDIFGSEEHNEEDQSITSFGLVPTKAEGQSISYDDAYQGYKKTYTHVTYGLGFNISRELAEDELYGKMRAYPKSLATSVRQTIETLAANHLNRAFNSSYPGSDAVEMCSELHPLVAGGTFSNEPSTAADLDVTAFEQSLIDIQAYVDDRGKKLQAMPQMLIVHPNDHWEAQIILQSAHLPDTANNDINPGKGALPKGYFVMHWLTDTDAWFITTNCPNGLTFFWRRRPEFTKDNDFDSENAKFKTTFRTSSGHTDPRGIYGSPGTG
jgi:hypothetical protein